MEVLGGEGAVAELGHFRVKSRADPRHFGFGDTRARAECFDEVVDLAGRDTVDVGLHHHGEQRLIDAAAPLQQGGEERALPQLRDPQIQVSGSRRQRPGSGPVAVGRAVAAALKRANTDERGCFRIDQLLIERFGREPEPVGDIGEFQLGEQVEQGRLI